MLFSNFLPKMNFKRYDPPILFIKLGINYLTERVTFRSYDFLSSNLSGKQIALSKKNRPSSSYMLFFSDGENPSRFSG